MFSRSNIENFHKNLVIISTFNKHVKLNNQQTNFRLRCKVEVGGELITSDLADDNISITGSSPNTEASHFTLCDQIDDCEQSLLLSYNLTLKH